MATVRLINDPRTPAHIKISKRGDILASMLFLEALADLQKEDDQYYPEVTQTPAALTIRITHRAFSFNAEIEVYEKIVSYIKNNI
jgi:hypothetical protein